MTTERVLVWDRFIRLFHWSLVTLFATAYITGEDAGVLHAYAGYGIAALIAARLIWGFIGSRHARFGDFVRGPQAVLRYFKALAAGEPQHFKGHNPAGGWMVLALLLAIAVTALSGMKLYGLEGHGPLAPNSALSLQIDKLMHREPSSLDSARASKADKEEWEEFHEAAANLTLLLVGLHVVAVIVSSRLHRENLVKAMVSGFKEAPHAN